MKKIIFTALVILGFIVIIATFYQKNGQYAANGNLAKPTELKSDNRPEVLSKNPVTPPTGQAFPVTNNVTMPEWALRMNNINKNPAFPRETKIKKLAEFLHKNANCKTACKTIQKSGINSVEF